MQSIIAGFQNIFTFSGRTGRGDFWPFALLVYFGVFALASFFFMPDTSYICDGAAMARGAADACIGPADEQAMLQSILVHGLITEIITFALLSSAVTRRLHDLGKSATIAMIYIVVELSLLAFTTLNMTMLLNDPNAASALLWFSRPYTIFSYALGLYLLYLLAQRGDPYHNRYDTEMTADHMRQMREELTGETETELMPMRRRFGRRIVD
jgi:uncharacterized membrane protein YhaH (DUF805 family)